MNKVASSAAMSGPIIPEDQWPDGADRHCWDANGLGFFHVPTTEGAQMWLLVLKQSHIPMPDGWDWRVPVMRHQPPAIDLEQFREAVCAYRLASLAGLTDCEVHGVKGHSFVESIEHADRLLALIDGQANVRSSSEHSDSLPATRSNTTHNLEKEHWEDSKKWLRPSVPRSVSGKWWCRC